MLSEYLNKTIEELTILEAGVAILIVLTAGVFIIGMLLWSLRPPSRSMRLPEPKPGEVNPYLEPLMEMSKRRHGKETGDCGTET